MNNHLQEKSEAFGLLMLALQYPDEEFIIQLQNGNFHSTVKEVLSYYKESPLKNQLLDDLEKLMVEYGKCKNTTIFSMLKREYERLFIGYRKLLAPPYASVYWNNTGILMREPAKVMQGAYKKWGFEISKEYRDLPDHIALQLEFLYHLGQLAIEDKNRVIYEEQKKIIDEMMLVWLPKYREKIYAYQELKFYGLIVDILLYTLENY